MGSSPFFFGANKNMLNKRADKLELLRIAEAVALEKSIDKELIISSMETGIAKAAKSKFGQENEIKVSINRETGDIEIFRKLISVNGVGATTARIMLSSLTSDEITAAIISGDVETLKSIKGIGTKSAQRIIVDLKDKLGKIEGLEENILTFNNNTHKDEALSALLALGFTKNVVEKVLIKVLKAQPDLDVEGLIKGALKNL